MHDAASGPRDTFHQHCLRVGSSHGIQAAVGSAHATRQFAPASHRRTLPTGHRYHLPPTHGMYAASCQERVVNPVDIRTSHGHHHPTRPHHPQEPQGRGCRVRGNAVPHRHRRVRRQSIAEARNDGHGGSTFVRALQGHAALLGQAEKFAKSLPPVSLDVEREDDEPLLIDMTLDFLVDELADAMHAERKLRTAFNRDIGNKVPFLKSIKLKAMQTARCISQSCAADRTGPSSSWPSCQRTRHSPSVSSMSWTTSPADPASPHRHDRPALVVGLFFVPARINRGWTRCRFPTDVAQHPHEAARMFADSSAHASSQGFRLPRGSLRATHQSASHPLRGRAFPRR